jgi:hypothetical protein
VHALEMLTRPLGRELLPLIRAAPLLMGKHSRKHPRELHTLLTIRDSGAGLITSEGPDTDNLGLEANRGKSPEDQVSGGALLGPRPGPESRASSLHWLAGAFLPDTKQA